jgi:two-component system CheB/CheR fusion protein
MSGAEQQVEFERLLEFLRDERGFDLTGYKRPSLARRFQRRMHLARAADYAAYERHLQEHPEEFAQLFNTILINVTEFFRDPAAWDYLAAEIVPALLHAKSQGEPLRAWSAGCASGEEAYSIAMILADAMGLEAFRRRVKVYATDVDEEALAQARLGLYGEKAVAALKPELRERYFVSSGGRFQLRPELRRSLIFGRNDLVQDAPISRLDLLVCRNTLMYFNAKAQARILSKFHFALDTHGHDSGYLFLGRAETLLTHGELFAPVELRHRIFVRLPRRLPQVAPSNDKAPAMTPGERLLELALEETPLPRIVVDADGSLAHANQRARVLFTLSPKDVGRPLKDLEISYRPAELRSLLEQAHAERRAVTQTSVERRFANGDVQYLDIVVAPLYDERHNPLGSAITFFDISRSQRLQNELQQARQQLQAISAELQSSNEELETTNEELQSSNEELETTNEELQSTNEELETMNEELQSTNDELQALNEELRKRTEDADRSHALLKAVFASLRSGALALTRDLDVLAWNQHATELWGMREEEVLGRSLQSLEIGLPVAELRGLIGAGLAGADNQAEVVLDAVNRRGRKVRLRVGCAPLILPNGKRDGVVVTMDEL